MVNLTEFCESHDVRINAVSNFIQRNDEIKKHVFKKGKNTILDEEAFKLLEKKYPIPKPVQIINGIPETEFYKQLEEKDKKIQLKDETIQQLQAKIIQLQNEKADLMLINKDFENQTLLLEQNNRIQSTENAKKDEEIKDLKDEINKFKPSIFGFYKKEK